MDIWRSGLFLNRFSQLVAIPLVTSGFMAIAEEPAKSMSFQGYTGYFNTPSAYIPDSGTAHIGYGNQTEVKREYRGRTDYLDTHNFLASVSLWEHVEINARNAAYSRTIGGGSDVSANIKFNIPYIPHDWFKLSVGAQDLGGQVGFFDSKYIVASKYFESYKLDITLGAASSDSEFSRMNGAIGAIRWQPYNWIGLAAEYDGGSTNYGVEVSTPDEWFNNRFKLYSKVMLGASEPELDNETFFNAGIQIPLTQQRKKITPADLEMIEKSKAEQDSDINDYVNLLSRSLVRKGFSEFKLGFTQNQTHVVLEFDNSAYSRNYIDSLAVALGLLSQYLPDTVEQFTVRIKQADIVIESVSGTMSSYRQFLKGGPLEITSGQKISSSSIDWLDETSNFILKPKITFFPSLSTGIGTDYGMFDYSLGLMTHLELPLWKGAAITAAHVTQLTESSDYRDGRAFANRRQPDSALLNATFHQAFNLPFNSRVMFNYGRFSEDFLQKSVEADWMSDDGAHRVSLFAGDYEYQGDKHYGFDANCLNDPDTILLDCYKLLADEEDAKVQVAKYRYYSAPLNTSFMVKYGKYWAGDLGYHFVVSHFYDDIEINLSLRATKAGDLYSHSGSESLKSEYTKMLGIGFTIPIGSRKDYNNRYVNVRGRADYSFVVETLIGERLNFLTFGSANEARNFYTLSNHFNNFDKAGLAYLYQNKERLRSAFFELR